MDTAAFIQKVRSAGFSLALDCERLLVSPIENLTAEQRKSLADRKPEIIAALRSSETLLNGEGGNDLAPANDRVLIHVPDYQTKSGNRYSFDMDVPKAKIPALVRTSLMFELINDGRSEEELLDVLDLKYGHRLESINGEAL